MLCIMLSKVVATLPWGALESEIKMNIQDSMIKAIAIVTKKDLDEVYFGLLFNDYPKWEDYLLERGFKKYDINPCSVKQFANKNLQGKYIVSDDNDKFVSAIVDGHCMNNDDEIISHYYRKDW